MAEYKTYPTYKDSKIQWLGEIPEHWAEIKTKFLFAERVEKGHPNETLLAATQTQGVVSKDKYETRTVTAQKDFHLLKLVKKGDFVISLRSFQGGIEIAHEQGIISPAYTIMEGEATVFDGYFKHVFKSNNFISGLTTFVTGIREGQNIDYSKFRMSYLPLPPLSEQTAIANFLDRKTSDIADFIALKERTIALLKERAIKIAINGFEEPRLVKEWPDNFPNSWQVYKSKWIFEEVNIKNKPEKELLAVTQNRGVLPKSLCNENFVSPDEKGLLSQKFVPIESFVISLRSFQGGIEYSNYEGIVSPAYTIFKLIPELDSGKLRIYFKYFFKSKPFIELLNTIISGIRDGQNISYKDFGTLFLPIPDEQTQEELLKLDSLIITEQAQIEKEISLIKEYQQNLISEAVTGKIDVSDEIKVDMPVNLAAEGEVAYQAITQR